MKNKFFETLPAILGVVIFAMSVAWIASPIGLVTGGVSGIGIVVKELSGGLIPIFVTSFVLNVPLFVICTVQRGFKFILKSIIVFLSLTVALSVFESIPSPLDFEGDLIMSSVSYALLSGVGLGLVLRSGATSGGSDMLAAIIKHKRPGLAIASLIAVIDAAIVALGTFIFGLRISLYAVLAIFISSKVIDLVLSGFANSKTAFIVTSESEKLAKEISHELKRGTTGIDVQGMYTGEKKKMLMSVVSSRELGRLRQIVSECDSHAFVTVTDTHKVLGEGFGELFLSDSLG